MSPNYKSVYQYVSPGMPIQIDPDHFDGSGSMIRINPDPKFTKLTNYSIQIVRYLGTTYLLTYVIENFTPSKKLFLMIFSFLSSSCMPPPDSDPD